MTTDAATFGLVREENGSYSAVYGPFLLQSAFQPIFSQSNDGQLKLEALEALIRPSRGGDPFSPAHFFSLVEPGDEARIERLCRRLHVFNASVAGIGDALLFLNFDPAYFADYTDTLNEIEAFAGLFRGLGLPISQIVCEITEKQAPSPHILRALTDILREHRFKIAIDDYGAEESDFERLASLKPNIVKFDGPWVTRFMETSEGMALLRIMARQFRESGIVVLFEGLEEYWQIAACREIGVRLLQGYALASPAPLTTTTAQTDGQREPDEPATASDRAATFERATRPGRRQRVAFGRRGC